MSKEDWSYGYEEKYTDSNGKTWSCMVYPNQQGNYGMGVATAWSVKKNAETPPPPHLLNGGEQMVLQQEGEDMGQMNKI